MNSPLTPTGPSSKDLLLGSHWGGEINCNIDICTVRVSSQNKKFTSSALGADMESYFNWNQKIKTSISMLQETTANWKNNYVQELFTNIGKKANTNMSISTTCTDTLSESTWVAGGCSIFSCGPIQNRLINKGVDPTGMGRFAYQTFRGQGSIKIAFISAYRCCEQSITSAGIQTAFSQQWHYLRRKGHPCPNPRKQLLRDLQSFILEFIFNGYDVCLGMDANEDLDSNQQHLRTFAEECSLISIHETIFDTDFYTTNKIPATYNRGKKKIDHIFCTPRLLDCVKTATILAENTGIISDHRCLIVDFDAEQMLGNNLSSIVHDNSRMLKAFDGKGNSKYREELHRLLLKRNIYQRAEKLLDRSISTPFTTKMHRQAEDIDKYITRCMLKAEKRAVWKRETNFSPKKLKAGKTVQFWKITLSALRRNKQIPTDAMIHILESHIETNTPLPNNIDEAKLLLKQAINNYRNIEQQAKEIRLQFLEERAELETRQGNLSKAAAISKIMNCEASRTYFAALRRIMKRSRHQGGLKMIKVPNPDNPDTEIIVTDPEMIETYLLERNNNHYAQAQGTPFTSELGIRIGLSGTSPYSDSILDGTVNLSQLSPAVKAIFQQLKSYNLEEITDLITPEDLISAFSKWNEKTTTSPSGRHLGHYKALLLKLDDGTDENAEKILKLHCSMINIAQNRRLPFERWQKEVEIMLEKDQGDPKINRLRIICLYEADYNIFLKILWAHRLMKHAETRELFDEAQGGGRPNRTSHDVALKKMLTYTYARATRINFGFMDLDATACFDRIVAGFALLCSRKYGMPSKACELHGTTIATMKHHVKTALRVSEAFFHSTPEKMIFGSGQGSSGSPPLWTVCSDILFRALQTMVGTGMEFRSPDGKILSKRSTDAFVDDVTNGVNDGQFRTAQSEEYIHQRLQAQAEAWEQLLYSSGGKLELPKCLVYLMIHDFHNGEPILRKKELILSRIRIKCSSSNEFSTIKLLDCNESHKTLGTYQNPLSEPSQQIEMMKTKESTLCASFNSMKKVPKYQVKIAYNSFYCASLHFPLSTTLMTENESNTISKRSTRAIIGAMGVNRKFPRIIAHCPTNLLGLGLKSIYMDQWAKQIIQLLMHVNQNDENGKLYLMTLQHFQLICGTTRPLLEYPKYKTPHIQDRLVVGLRKFLAECNLSIKLPITGPPPQRENDRCLMDDILKVGKSPSQIRLFNQVRLYLNAFWLSDIANTKGDAIDPIFLKFSIPSDRPSFSKWFWPRQEYPNTKAWKTWVFLLRKLYMCHKVGKLGDLSIEENLGDFTQRSRRHRIWKWELSPELGQVIESRQTESKISTITFNVSYHRRKMCINPSEPADVNLQPETCIPIRVYQTLSNRITFAYPSVACTLQPEGPSPRFSISNNTICEFGLEKWEKHFIFPLHLQIPASISIEVVLIGVSSRTVGTSTAFGWSVRANDQQLANGGNFVPITNENANPVQGMLYGLHSALYSLKSIANTNWDRINNILVYSSNPALVKIINNLWKVKTHNPRWRTNRYFEILLYIYSTLSNTRLIGTLVNGDDNNGISLLVDAEKCTPDNQSESPQTKIASKLLKASLFSTNNGNHLQILSHIRESIHEHYTKDKFINYHLKKYSWSKSNFDSINWKAFQHAARNLSINNQVKLMKFVYGWLPIGSRRIAIDPESSDLCPSCGLTETHDHLIRCEHPDREALKDSLIKSFIDTSIRSHMPLHETTIIANCLEMWITSGLKAIPITTTIYLNKPLLSAITEQNSIGWNHFVRGRISSNFQLIPNNLRSVNLSTYESNKWTIETIRTMWYQISDMWDTRNRHLHGDTPEDSRVKKREKLLEAAKNLYDRKHELEISDQNKIFPPWENTIKLPTSSLKIWIMTVKQTINILLDESKQADDDPTNMNLDI